MAHPMTIPPLKETTAFTHFEALDIRVGRIVDVADAATRKPTYRMTIDFGPEIGTRTSCGAYRNYTPEQLVGRQVVCLVNCGARRMGPEVSEALVLGVPTDSGGTTYLTVPSVVRDGVAVF